MSNRYSSFPDALDELKKLTEVQEMTVAQKQKVARCTELSLKADLTPSEEIELQKLMQELKGFRLDSSDWNKVVETLMNTQKYIKENILGEVGDLVDAWEKYINNMITTKEQEVTTTVTQAKEEINTLKVSTMEELSQKVSDIVSNGKVGLDFFKGQIVLKSNSTSVIINIPEYNRTTDFLTVYVNGALITEGVNYTIGNDNFSIKSIGGDWTTGTVFDFVVLKKTIVKLEHYDVGLFEDGTIRKEKLTVDLQNKIGKVDEIERNLTKFTTDTNSSLEKINKQQGDLVLLKTTEKSNLVGAINEVKDSVGKDKIGDMKQFAVAPPDKTWLPCDGATYNKADYPELHAILSDKDIKQEVISEAKLTAISYNNYIIQCGDILYKLYDGYSSSTSTKVKYSDDGGVTWKDTVFDEGWNATSLSCVEYYDGHYYFLKTSEIHRGRMADGSDSVLFTPSSSFQDYVPGKTSMLFYGNTVIIPGYYHADDGFVRKNVCYSNDGGLTFKSALVGLATKSNYAAVNIGVVNGIFMLKRYSEISSNFKYYISTTGEVWEEIKDLPWEKVTKDGKTTIFVYDNKFTAINGGIKYTSIDGKNWSESKVEGIESYKHESRPLLYGNKIFFTHYKTYYWSFDCVKFHKYISPSLDDKSSHTAYTILYTGAYLPNLKKALVRGNTTSSSTEYMYQLTFNEPYTLDTFVVPTIIDGYSYIKAKE